MPPKKRKVGVDAAAPTVEPADAPLNKKVRMNGKSKVTETAAATRPRRGSASPALPAPAVKRGRGRPSKSASNTPAPVSKPAKASTAITTSEAPVKSTKTISNTKAKAAGAQKTQKTKAKSSAARRGSNVSVELAVNGNDEEEEKVEDDEEQDEQFWLMKAEPDSRIEKGVDVKFSIDDLAAADEPEGWDGVRNLSARNNMRLMRKGDQAFFYHSNTKTPGIVGIMEIVQEHSVDESAFDAKHPYYDEKSDRAKPKWELVHVKFIRKFDDMIKLSELKSFAQQGGILKDLQTLRQSRLSVSRVTPKQWKFIMSLVDGEEEQDVETKSKDQVVEEVSRASDSELEARD